MATIQIDSQSFDIAIEHFSFSSYHDIEDMSELAKLRLLARLTSATFNGTNLDDCGLLHVASVSTLENLDLQDTKISNDGLRHLTSLRRLKYLRLKDNPQLTNDCISHILRLEALVNLQIHETSIDQDGVNQLVTLANLQDICLDVRGSNYTFQALLELSARMPQCTILAKGRGEFCGGEFDGKWGEST